MFAEEESYSIANTDTDINVTWGGWRVFDLLLVILLLSFDAHVVDKLFLCVLLKVGIIEDIRYF